MLRRLWVLPIERRGAIGILVSLVGIAFAPPTLAAERNGRKPSAAKLQMPQPARQKAPDRQSGRDWSGAYGGINLGAPPKEPDWRLP